jgi:hypothetical protein
MTNVGGLLISLYTENGQVTKIPEGKGTIELVEKRGMGIFQRGQ